MQHVCEVREHVRGHQDAPGDEAERVQCPELASSEPDDDDNEEDEEDEPGRAGQAFVALRARKAHGGMLPLAAGRCGEDPPEKRCGDEQLSTRRERTGAVPTAPSVKQLRATGPRQGNYVLEIR